MSQINDALKQVRKVPPRGAPHSLPPLQPIARESSSVIAWLMPAIVIILVIAAIFFIGWAVAHHSVNTIVTAPETVMSVTQQVEEVTLPVIAPEPPAPVNPPDAPRLQGIFYSATAPSAIVEGKTVRPGDRFQQYRVKAITKSTVVLVDAAGKTIQLGMSN